MHPIRRVLFRPYRQGMGPTFALSLWDTGRTAARGTSLLRYRLTMNEGGKRSVLFDAANFSPSPMHSDDGDKTVKGVMGFLTLRPGDTDREYFDDYTPAQLEYCAAHAETLGWEVYARFGE